MSVYGTPNNNGGVVFSFGNVSNSNFSQSDAGNSQSGEFVPSPRSANKVFPSGSLNPYGSYVVFAGRQATINGLANTEAAEIGSVAAPQTGGTGRARKVGIESVDSLTNTITYVNDSWTDYDLRNTAGDGISEDVIDAAITSPYSVPAEFTYLDDMTPETVSYSTAK